ncbi:PadR family transcriptional regulator [Flavobacterium sp. MK4S-17]|jgi:DNA-binding PadR family transcriptional regulator|uniref:PadR family transcriptional regulator n=1 Tax=Flavobacterium sp. MK4S-17 TaxID=2543737 RepID=UPI00135B2319|nr:PadR family transcriptional regulator [Flavobacterium sp. MK4S-17]
MYNKELTKGTLQPIILKLLSDSDKMYGYEITQKVKELTKGKIDISEGALYPILHKMEAENILETEKVYIGKRVRKYYKVTGQGKKAAQKVTEELQDFIETLSIIFKQKELAYATDGR